MILEIKHLDLINNSWHTGAIDSMITTIKHLINVKFNHSFS